MPKFTVDISSFGVVTITWTEWSSTSFSISRQGSTGSPVVLATGLTGSTYVDATAAIVDTYTYTITDASSNSYTVYANLALPTSSNRASFMNPYLNMLPKWMAVKD